METKARTSKRDEPYALLHVAASKFLLHVSLLASLSVTISYFGRRSRSEGIVNRSSPVTRRNRHILFFPWFAIQWHAQYTRCTNRRVGIHTTCMGNGCCGRAKDYFLCAWLLSMFDIYEETQIAVISLLGVFSLVDYTLSGPVYIL